MADRPNAWVEGLEQRFCHAAELLPEVAPGPESGLRTIWTSPPAPSEVVAVGRRLYFTAYDGPGEDGMALWAMNTVNLRRRIVLRFGTRKPGDLPRSLTRVGDGVAFMQADGRIWFSDGTTDGTRMLKRLPPADEIGPLVVSRGKIYAASLESRGEAVWQLNPATGDARRLAGFRNEVVSAVHPAGGSVLVATSDGNVRHETTTLWSVSPSGGEPVKLGAILDAYVAGAAATVGRTTYFGASGTSPGPALWRTDGTPEGTRLVRQFTDEQYGFITSLTPMNGNLYFIADHGNTRSLWRSDGATAGTVRLGGNAKFSLDRAGDRLYFGGTANDLWTSDGTPAGTRRVRRFRREVGRITPAGDDVYVVTASVSVPNLGSRVWRTDGTAEMTVLLGKFFGGRSSPFAAAVIGDDLYLAAARESTGHELWRVRP
jgi:ELWxxDGT repeat protein